MIGELLGLVWEYLKTEILKYPLFLLGRWKLLLVAITATIAATRRGRENWKLMTGISVLQVVLNAPVVFSEADIFTKIEAVFLCILGALLAYVFFAARNQDDMEIEDENGQKIKVKKSVFYQDTLEKAKTGNVQALYNLGICCRSGIGRKTDYEAAKKYFALVSQSTNPVWRAKGEEALQQTKRMEEEEVNSAAETLIAGIAAFLGFEEDD